MLLYSVEVKSTSIIEVILVIREFPEVFPLEIENLPLEREVDFSIDLLPSIGPILIALYQMSSFKLRKLKVQLEDLLENNFNRSSTCPWGAPSLFVKKKNGTL